MIIVTGTKRSGTSMWMQILQAAGYRVLGDAFPRDWGQTIRAANQRGFFESSLRHGIHDGTNPHPRTGALLSPGGARDLVVKVFAAGLVRTDLVYIDKVVASMRHWREYAASLERLYAMEQINKLELARQRGLAREVLPSLAHPPPILEWWNDNFTLIRDAQRRRYPIRWVSYAAVLCQASREVADGLAWLGDGNVGSSLRVVRAELRTQRSESIEPQESGLAREHEALIDELYARVDQHIALDQAFLERLGTLHEQLAPRFAAAERQVREERRRARSRARAALGELRRAKGRQDSKGTEGD